MLELPVFVTVSDTVCLSPAVTLPKFTLVGFDPSAPAATPVPNRGTFSVGFEALEVTVTLPLAVPAEDGLKETENVALCPAVSVTGVEIPLTLNPVPLAAT